MFMAPLLLEQVRSGNNPGIHQLKDGELHRVYPFNGIFGHNKEFSTKTCYNCKHYYKEGSHRIPCAIRSVCMKCPEWTNP
jgi:hypothetical protein